MLSTSTRSLEPPEVIAMAGRKKKEVTEAALARIKEGKNNLSMRELGTHLLDVCGGTKQLALMLFKEMKNTEPGSMTRARIVDLILQAFKAAAGQSSTEDEIGLLTEDDLANEAMSLIEKMEIQHAPATTGGQDPDVPPGVD